MVRRRCVALCFPLLLMACGRRSSPLPTAEAAAEHPAGVISAEMGPSAPVGPTQAAASSAPSASVAAASEAAPKAKPADPFAHRPRVYAKARFVWVARAPRSPAGWIGFLGAGDSAPLKADTPAAAAVAQEKSCTWYAIEPLGYVCAGGAEATLDPADPVYQQAKALVPDFESPYPLRYGSSIGAPRYPSLPTAKDLARREPDLTLHQEAIARVRAAGPTPWGVEYPPAPKVRETRDEWLRGVDLGPAREPVATSHMLVSPLLREERDYIVPHSTISWAREIEHEGRAYLLTADHAVIPKDRVRPFPRSEFRGVKLGGEVQLPMAFVRGANSQPRYVRAGDGFAPSGDPIPRHGHVMVTGRKETVGKQVFLETREPGVWVDAGTVTVAAPSEPPTMPLRDAAAGRAPGARASWFEVSVLGGWLIAYEYGKPVYVTLISPGRGTVPVPGIDPRATASTPVGLFRVDGKFRTATMVASGDPNLVHTDVNWVMNFHGPHALHGAYWHDKWGEPKSAGCINLSSADAKWAFEFAEPRMPEGWRGARTTDVLGGVTVVWVHP
jgi:hypothetical protein